MLDLTQTNSIQGIENIDLNGGNNSVRLDLNSLLNMSDTDIVRISGDSSNAVSTADSGWSYVGVDNGYNQYTNGTATIYVETQVNQDGITS